LSWRAVKPSTDSESLLVQIEKNKFFLLGLGLSVGDVTSGDVFALLWPTSLGHVRQSNEPFLTQDFIGI